MTSPRLPNRSRDWPKPILYLISGVSQVRRLPSQPQRITSGLRETFIKGYIAERANKAEIRPEEQSEKAVSCRENLCRAPYDAVCASLTHYNRFSPPSSLSCAWSWPSKFGSEGCVHPLKLCTVRQPGKKKKVWVPSICDKTFMSMQLHLGQFKK